MNDSPSDTQRCPVCGIEQPRNPRYPRYLCPVCAGQAVDETGRALVFGNVDFSEGEPANWEGFLARYADTNEARDSHVCYVRGIRCWADEARFGGIVIQTEA